MKLLGFEMQGNGDGVIVLLNSAEYRALKSIKYLIGRQNRQNLDDITYDETIDTDISAPLKVLEYMANIGHFTLNIEEEVEKIKKIYQGPVSQAGNEKE